MNDEIVNFSQIISNTFKNIRCEDVENADKLFDTWKKVLFGIKGIGSSNKPGNPFEGQNLYDHTRILDLKNKTLLIEADHPGWIQLLQMHKKFIITGMNKFAPELEIKNLVFKLKGTPGELANVQTQEYSVEKTKQVIQQQIEDEEAKLNENSILKSQISDEEKAASQQKKELPPELKVLFADLEQSMLTNSKN